MVTIADAAVYLRARSRVNERTGCREWTRLRDRAGYGIVRRYRPNGTRATLFAHRLAWESERGPIPAGKFVLHKCDNPPCCNVDHLYVGTIADNVRDLHERGRPARFPGAANPSAKLNDVAVRVIRYCAAHGWTLREVATAYGISPSQAGRIARRAKWAHLP